MFCLIYNNHSHLSVFQSQMFWDIFFSANTIFVEKNVDWIQFSVWTMQHILCHLVIDFRYIPMHLYADKCIQVLRIHSILLISSFTTSFQCSCHPSLILGEKISVFTLNLRDPLTTYTIYQVFQETTHTSHDTTRTTVHPQFSLRCFFQVVYFGTQTVTTICSLFFVLNLGKVI